MSVSHVLPLRAHPISCGQNYELAVVLGLQARAKQDEDYYASLPCHLGSVFTRHQCWQDQLRHRANKSAGSVYRAEITVGHVQKEAGAGGALMNRYGEWRLENYRKPTSSRN